MPASANEQRLTSDLVFYGSGVQAQVLAEAAVLGDERGAELPFRLFSTASPVIALEEAPAAVLSAEPVGPTELAFTPSDDAVYVLLQTTTTDEGVIYDVALPQRSAEPSAVLGGEPTPTVLRFTVNSLHVPPPSNEPSAVLGIGSAIGGMITGAAGRAVGRRVLQMLKAPVQKAVLQGVAHAEGPAEIQYLRASDKPEERLVPLAGAESWRSLLAPGVPRRVLLYIPGLATSPASALPALEQLAHGYDAVLAYKHPSISRNPQENALQLLEQIPADLQLQVDLLAHSRGGLVARSLVELVEPLAQFTPRTVIMLGTPQQGTPLAAVERWESLISLLMTAAGFVGSLAGVTLPATVFIEWLLRAAAQTVFELPGINAMAPQANNPFLGVLNTPLDPASPLAAQQGQARYLAVTSRYSIFNEPKWTFRTFCEGIAAQAFFNQPNDLLVPTASMQTSDAPLAAEQQLLTDLPHWGYLADPTVLEFAKRELADVRN
jgi:hypothetical protein